MVRKLKLVDNVEDSPAPAGGYTRDDLLENFELFCREGLGMPLHDKPHIEMCQFVSDLFSPNIMMLVPRACWKTSLGSTALPLWKCLRAYFIDGNPAFRTLIDSSTVRLSNEVLKLIKSYVRYNDKFISYFGELYDRKGDGQDSFSLKFRITAQTGKKEPNFLASGVGSAKTGLHFELIVLDDLVEPRNVRTDDQRQKVWDHYRMLQGIIDADVNGQNTTMLILGTRYHDADMYGRILKQDKESVASGGKAIYTTMIRAAVDDMGELFFPDKLTHDELVRRKGIMRGMFNAQFMNDPNAEDAPFKPEGLRWKSLVDFPKEIFKVRLTVDPAFKADEAVRGDYCAMIVMCWDKWNQPWILDVSLRDNLTPGTFIDEFFRMAMHWDVEQIIMEDDHMAAMDLLIRREMQDKNFSRQIVWVPANKQQGKLSRWLELQPYAERGGIRIADEIPAKTKVEIEDQWCRAPFAANDDFMDALALQTMFLPFEIEDVGPQARAVFGNGRDTMEMLASPGVLMENQYRLIDRFPHIKALLLDQKTEWTPDQPWTDDLSADLGFTEAELSFD